MQSHFPQDHPGGGGKEGNVGTSFQLCYSRGNGSVPKIFY
jgi:hypothetical protein